MFYRNTHLYRKVHSFIVDEGAIDSICHEIFIDTNKYDRTQHVRNISNVFIFSLNLKFSSRWEKKMLLKIAPTCTLLFSYQKQKI